MFPELTELRSFFVNMTLPVVIPTVAALILIPKVSSKSACVHVVKNLRNHPFKENSTFHDV